MTLDELPASIPNGFHDADLTLSGLMFWVAEPPDALYPYRKAGVRRIDIGSMESLERKKIVRLPPVPEGAFVNWVFVTDWNAFIHAAAEDARLKWLGSKKVRHHPPPNPARTA